MQNKIVAVVALMAVFSLAVCFIILGAISTDLMHSPQDQRCPVRVPDHGAVPDQLHRSAADRPGGRQVRIQAGCDPGLCRNQRKYFPAGFRQQLQHGFRRLRPARRRRHGLQHRRQHADPGRSVRGKDPARASNFGNAFFGMGYVLTPFLFTLFMQKLGLSYSTSLSVFGVLVLVFLVFALVARIRRSRAASSLARPFPCWARPRF